LIFERTATYFNLLQQNSEVNPLYSLSSLSHTGLFPWRVTKIIT